jgi:hypothetical protein
MLMGLHTDGGGTERRKMNAKKLLVSLVTAVTLTLFGGAAYAQQLTVPQEDDIAQATSTQQEECDRTHEQHGQA